MASVTGFGKDCIVVIPSYNESDNLRILIPKITKVLSGVQIVVVDDSPTEERKKLENIRSSQKSDNVSFIFRNHKSGRGSAVIDGLKYAANNTNRKYFIEMDADMAHDPDDIPKLFAKTDMGDVVIGSRYLSGSHIKDWPIRRLYQSKMINFFLNYWLGLKLSDYTNGLRLYNRKAVNFLTNVKLYEKGFISLSEIAYKLKKAGFRLTEVPITFTDRKYGKSNADFNELVKSLVGAVRIRIRG